MNPTRVDEAVDILLVEPSPGDTRLFTETFREAELLNNVYAVTDGETALDFLHQRGDFSEASLPDVILLDPQLPGRGGEAVLQELKGDPCLADIPVILLTSSAAEERIVRSHGPDVDGYITKPVDPEEFVSFVRTIEDVWLAIVQREAEH